MSDLIHRLDMAAVDLAIAHAWAETDDKFIFCLSLLGLSLSQDGEARCIDSVDLLEDHFEEVLSNAKL